MQLYKNEWKAKVMKDDTRKVVLLYIFFSSVVHGLVSMHAA